MALKPDASLSMGLACGALVYGVYSNATPTIADIRGSAPNDPQLYGASKGAFLTSVTVVSAISLLARDPTIFCIGGAVALALEWQNRHANAVDPESGSIVVPLQYVGSGGEVSDGMLTDSPIG